MGIRSRSDDGSEVAGHYSTTAFTALDFLSNDPRREAAIREHFGDQVAELVVLDRKRLIRKIFGVALTHRRKPVERS